MLKSISLNLEVVESMLYYWSSVADREKVVESFFVDVANMDAMKMVQRPDFSEESIRKVLSAIQNKELLSAASKAEKRFWSKNMWIADDVQLASKMAQPIKVMNVDDLVDRLNEKYPNIQQENIVVHIAPLHLDDYYIIGDTLIINFFKIYFDDDDNALFEDMPIKEFIFQKLCELIESK